MRFAMSMMGILLSTNAFAGGVGLLATGGFYTETVYFYDSSKEFQQYQQSQTIGTYGTGVEVALGDRDDRIMGMARWYWIQETPQKDPALSTGLVDTDNVVANWRENTRNVGIFTVGLQWAFLKKEKFSLNANAMFGSGFLTTDHTEFFMAEAGAGAAYRLSTTLDAHIEVQYAVRNRKGLLHGVNTYAGLRYLFD
jgi:hypothetical protein